MAEHTPEAIAKWAEAKAKPAANTPGYRRLSNADRMYALERYKAGDTQTAIAQRLGVTQSAISQWLSSCEDSTEMAGLYLRGQALHMARNVVKKGQARDHIAALKGVGVLEADKTQLNLAIGVSLPGLNTVSAPVISVSSLSPSPEQS